MLNSSVQDIYNKIVTFQKSILSKDYVSNEDIMRYFAYLSLYKYKGGKRNIGDITREAGMFDKLPSEKAVSSFVTNMVHYTCQGQIFLKVYKAFNSTKSSNLKDLVIALNRQFKNHGIILEHDASTDTFRLRTTQYTLRYMSSDMERYIYMTRLLAMESLGSYKLLEDKYFRVLLSIAQGDKV